MISQLLTNMFAGSVTGFITNSLAIKMLFRKYPVVGGGILIDNYEEFIENISALVERDLINHSTLKNEFKTEEFKEQLSIAIDSMLKEHIYSIFPNTPLKEIDGFEETLESIAEFLQRHEKKLLELLLDETFANIEVSELIGSTQQKELSERLFNLLKDNFEASLPEMLKIFENSEESIESYLISQITTILKQSIPEQIGIFQEIVSSHERELKESMVKLYKIFNTEEIISSVLDVILNKNLTQLLGEDTKEQVASEVVSQLFDFLMHSDSDETLESMTQAAVDELRLIDEPVANFLTQKNREHIIGLIKLYLPYAITVALEWINKNREELEALIDRLVDASLASGGVFGKIKIVFKELFIGKITERFSVVERITNFLQNEQSQEESVDRITTGVIDAISNRSIGSIVNELTSKNIVTAELIVKVIRLNMIYFTPIIRQLIIDNLFSKSLNELYRYNLSEDIMQKELSSIFAKKALWWIQKESSREFMSKSATATLIKILKTPIKKWLEEEGFLETLLDIFEKNQEKVKNEFSKKILSFTSNNSVKSALLPPFDAYVVEHIFKKVQYDKEALILKISNTSTHSAFNLINSYEGSQKRVTAMVLMGIEENLHHLLEENVSVTVKKELFKLGPEVLQRRVEDFMGKELGPITWLGAGIGAGVGAGLYAVGGQFASLSPVALSVTIPAIYGLTGIGTNWLALKMLFKPYEKRELFGIGLPFTPGVVGKKKPKFAYNMSEFVDNTLLRKDAIREIIVEHKLDLTKMIKEYVKRDDFVMINDFLKRHSYELEDRDIRDFLDHMRSQIDARTTAEIILKEIDRVDISELLNPKKSRQFFNTMHASIIDDATEVFSQWYELNFDKKLKEAAPKGYEDISNKLSKMAFMKGVDMLRLILNEHEEFKLKLSEISDPFYKEYSSKTLEEVLPENLQRNLELSIGSYVVNRFQNFKVQQKVLELTQLQISEAMEDGSRTVGELFNGKLVEIIDDNISLIFEHGFLEVAEFLKSEEHAIVNEVEDFLRSKSNFFTQKFLRVSGIFGDIERFINIFLHTELPVFLSERQDEIANAIESYLDELKDKGLKEIGVESDIIDLNAYRPIFSKLLYNGKIIDGIDSISFNIVQTFYSRQVGELLRLFNLSSTKRVLDVFDEEVSVVREHLLKSLDGSSESIEDVALNATKTLSKTFFETCGLSDLFPRLRPRTFQKQINFTMKKSLSHSAVSLFEDNLVSLAVQRFKADGIDSLFNERVLKEDMSVAINGLLENENLISNLALHIRPIVAQLLFRLNDLSDEKFKLTIMEYGLEAAYETILHNFEGLISSMDFKSVIEREINLMHPKELEDMLNSFAKVYFKRLILYGGYGALFGIPVALSY